MDVSVTRVAPNARQDHVLYSFLVSGYPAARLKPTVTAILSSTLKPNASVIKVEGDHPSRLEEKAMALSFPLAGVAILADFTQRPRSSPVLCKAASSVSGLVALDVF